KTAHIPIGPSPVDEYHNQRYKTVDYYFDKDVMNKLGDHNAIYRDGALGGLASFAGVPNNPLSAIDRYSAGTRQGSEDAKAIIDNLSRDKNGNITETIKIITHSMGGVYGSGYLAALKKYIKTLPKEQQSQIKISLVADFDPFQGSSITGDGET